MKHHEERPLGFRERARLREELLAYTEQKALIRELAPEHDVRREAITRCYDASGGNSWKSPTFIANLVNQVRHELRGAIS